LLHAGLAGLIVTLLGRRAIWLTIPSRFAMWRFSIDANIALYFSLGAVADGKLSLIASAAGAVLALLGGSFTAPARPTEA
jgi:hypothetical protein